MSRRHVLVGQISELANGLSLEQLEVSLRTLEVVNVDNTTMPELVAFLASRRLPDRLDNNPAEVISRLVNLLMVEEDSLRLLESFVTQDVLNRPRTGIRNVVYHDGGPSAFQKSDALALDQVLDLLQIGGELRHGWGMRTENILPAFIGGKYYSFEVRLRASGHIQLSISGPSDEPRLSGTGSTRVFFNKV